MFEKIKGAIYLSTIILQKATTSLERIKLLFTQKLCLIIGGNNLPTSITFRDNK
jgi:hypothetical protein